jgi:hypothetical protein
MISAYNASKGADSSNTCHERMSMPNLTFVDIKAKSEHQKRIILIVRFNSDNAKGLTGV